ncbi:hypothetical protein ACGFIW_01470 [Micromonospora sp. NPDC048935]|uniref:hypothetical protein n=1 Tax=Micromonospora sp. NPDC048935 TaxID=3364262 RepID=UPI00371981D5
MPTTKPGRVIRLRDREWTLQRLGGYMPWQVTHLPTQVVFRDSSEADARRQIKNGWYGRKVADRMRPEPPSRRDWWQDPITGVWHLWKGGMFDWTCWVHDRVCDPLKPITADDILRMAARDGSVDDDVFVVLRQAAENRSIDLNTDPKG